MKRRHLSFLGAVILLASCSSGQKPEQAFPSLSFHDDGTFKIVQFTDTHLCYNLQEEFAKAVDQLRWIIEAESPDLVIFTGDVVTGRNAEPAWKEFFVPLDEKNIPFAVVLGNHDREVDLTEKQILDLATAHPANVNVAASGGYLDDFVIEVKAHGSDRTAALLYLMDSGDYSISDPLGGYGWFTNEQIQWYLGTSKSFTKANGNKPVPAYAFFHIPLNEYHDAYERNAPFGSREENECPGKVNGGMFAALLEGADVHATFVGHDHVNDYAADFGNVSLVYGRRSGFNTTYHNLPNGNRVIVLKEDDYGFRTYVREQDTDAVVLDSTFVKNIDYNLRNASAAGGSEPGISMAEYKGIFPDGQIEEGELVESKVVPSPRIDARATDAPHGFIFEGYLYVPQSNLWTVHVTGDDEARVRIDDISFASRYNRGQVKMNLEKGLHPIRIEFTSSEGSERLKLQWRSLDSDRYHEIPPECFFVK